MRIPNTVFPHSIYILIIKMIETIFKKITRHYGLAFLVIWLGSQLLANPETPYVLILLGVFIVHAWVYFVHRGLHIAHDMKLLDFFNTHMRFHHQSEKDLPRPLELFFECITDMTMNLSIIPVQKLLGINLIPMPVIILFALTYTTIHIVNYSMFGSLFHRRHHETKIKNYAPDAMDHLCKTNYNEEHEDLNVTVLNIFAVMAVLYPIKDIINKL